LVLAVLLHILVDGFVYIFTVEILRMSLCSPMMLRRLLLLMMLLLLLR
jgi:hypothetical protein